MPKHSSDDVAQIIWRLRRKSERKLSVIGSSNLAGGGDDGGGSESGERFHNPLDGEGQLIVGGAHGALKKFEHPGLPNRFLKTTSTGLQWDTGGGGGGGGSGGLYKLYTVVANTEGGFQILNDGAGNPVYTLEATT